MLGLDIGDWPLHQLQIKLEQVDGIHGLDQLCFWAFLIQVN